ncbi:MAG: HAMP domain-containing sensor histidine kinase [Bacteroidales bacterium]|nr:HAMP domain-containing sensor histidine kinase [Bacteroidales bacterium]
MNIYLKKQNWKILLFVIAILIAIASVIFTNSIVKELSIEERNKVELWANGMKELASIDNNSKDLGLIFEVIENNTTIPVILTDKQGNIKAHRNLDELRINKDKKYLIRQLEKMKEENEVIKIALYNGDNDFLYYRNSTLLVKLFYFPIVQFIVIMIFLLISYFAFSVSRKAEQNQVWLGMSKETAHQLGTPTSSLMANVELLKMQDVKQEVIDEFQKDVNRLDKITDRFSKIGSPPKLKKQDINKVIIDTINYLKRRSSDKINFILEFRENETINVLHNGPLFEWVIENVIKNAVDSMNGEGNITIKIDDRIQYVFIDILDNGIGIPKSKYKTIFQPGYTTKHRGWG